MAEKKNYPIKKRPLREDFVIDSEPELEMEQIEPLNLCTRPNQNCDTSSMFHRKYYENILKSQLTNNRLTFDYASNGYYDLFKQEYVESNLPRESTVSPFSSSETNEEFYNRLSKASETSETSDAPGQYCDQKTSTSQRYRCNKCGKFNATYSGLTKHIQFHCRAIAGNDCEQCPKTYTSSGALKMHINTHTRPFQCTHCENRFSRPWLLKVHIRTHTGEKPFVCAHCERAFADRSNLRAHLQTHSAVKKYACKTCTKTFSRMSSLTKHNNGGCPGMNQSSSPKELR
ncbi:Zinc finger protein [Pseudolycoriella hygida]|uniref:Zinc finger protein n=1 Tax=Pseudolycoriella hygida TaxID=35572 RepID=A0A9Q0NEY2_9DIPT|nr:Zinc finger protein [Pseudolycoriella hygida]